MTLLRDLIEIPESAAGNIFVLNLQDGVKDDHAAQTLREYVITDSIAARFDDALELIASSLGVDSANRPVGRAASKASYLHGSFGSGKSHFMAILHLLLQGNPDALARPELAKVVAKHRGWMAGRRFLLVAHHLIGAKSVESAVYENYRETVARLHPGTPLPDLHDDDAIFEAAAKQREMLGETKFFELLNTGADPNWGSFASASDWSSESYRRVCDGGEGTEERRRLAGLVGERVLPGRVVVEGRYAGFNDGLERISQHAKSLGYDAVVLFLDEFILWLASRAGEPNFVSEQAEKAVKLVDADHAERPAPIVTFIARQRLLRELIGAGNTGLRVAMIEDTLAFHEARFKTIELKGTELPEIVSRRLLRPKDDAAAATLKQAFDRTIGSKPELAKTLSGGSATEQEFAKVHPFSPVLIDALVQAASMLQRDRTALKAMLQILVSRRETLALGELIPAGDLYDVVKEGREAISEHYRERFTAAKRIYEQKFLPLLEEAHGTTAAAIQNKPWDDPARRKWRRDDRLFKTVLLAALVPAVPAFRDLNATTLARLNHGSVASLIPGEEASEVLQLLRRWASSIGELSLAGDAANPTVSLAISGIDVDGIVKQAQVHDTHDARRQLLKRLVYQSLGIEDRGAATSLEHEWRGTERKASIVFQNVGSMTTAMLGNDDEPWKIVIDYPIDEADVASAVAADRKRIAEFEEQGHTGRTIVWRPRFLNQAATRELGRLAMLERLASRSEFDQAARHLSADERDQAWPLLESQRNSLRQRMLGALQAAYGLSNEPNAMAMIDASVDVGESFKSLEPNLSIRPPGTAELRRGLLDVFEQALESQFPAAPRWERVFKPNEIRTALDTVRQALGQPGHRLQLGQDGLRLMKRFAEPLELGETGSAFVLKDRWKQLFDREAQQAGLASPTVADLRRWMDQPKARGLPRPVQDLLILAYAEHAERGIHRDGSPLADVSIGGLREEDRLVLTPLPSQKAWEIARERAGELFGIADSSLVPTSAHLAGLAQKVRATIGSGRDRLIERVARALELLTPRWAKFGIADGDRERELAAGREALKALGREASDDRRLIEAIAAVDATQSAGLAMGAAIKSAAEVAAAVESANWDLIEAASGKDAAIREAIRSLLQCSELRHGLRDGLREIERQATRVVTGPVAVTPPASPQPGPPSTPPPSPSDGASGGTSAGASPIVRRLRSEQDLIEVVESIRSMLGDAEVEVHWRRVDSSERDGR